MLATDVLRNEHEVILQVLDCLEELARRAEVQGTIDSLSARSALDFFGSFADRCHHAKEEQRLFPALQMRGMPLRVGPLAVMLHEHELGRAAITAMRTALDDAARNAAEAPKRFAAAARGYVELLREHIDKENRVLFSMADEMLGPEVQDELLRGFEHIEHDDLQAGTHERYIRLARDLCVHLGISWAPHAPGVATCCGHDGGCH